MKLRITGILLIVLAACGNPEGEKEQADAFGKSVEYAKHFRIFDRGDYKELQILNPESGKAEKKYALTSSKDVGLPSDLVRIEVPLRSVVALSGTQIGMMDKLGCAGKISGVSSRNYIANAIVLEGCRSGKVLEFEDFGMLNPERVLQTGAKVIAYSGFEGSAPPKEAKLLKLGILCLPDYDWKENHPLGKAEWIKVFGALFGKEKEAAAYFDKTVKEYNRLKAEAAALQPHPTVFAGMVFGDTWYMPAGESFGAVLLGDAGGNYTARNEKGTGSVAYSFEKTFRENRATEYWINIEVQTKEEMLRANEKYRYFDAFRKGNLYTYAHRMNYFWENSAIEPHHVLSDLVQILHAGKVKRSKLYFYKKLG